MNTDEVYGGLLNDKIYINIELLWKISKSEEDFIRKYSSVVLHEVLHLEVKKIIEDLFIEGEEKVIDTISNTNSLP